MIKAPRTRCAGVTKNHSIAHGVNAEVNRIATGIDRVQFGVRFQVPLQVVRRASLVIHSAVGIQPHAAQQPHSLFRRHIA